MTYSGERHMPLATSHTWTRSRIVLAAAAPDGLLYAACGTNLIQSTDHTATAWKVIQTLPVSVTSDALRIDSCRDANDPMNEQIVQPSRPAEEMTVGSLHWVP